MINSSTQTNFLIFQSIVDDASRVYVSGPAATRRKARIINSIIRHISGDVMPCINNISVIIIRINAVKNSEKVDACLVPFNLRSCFFWNVSFKGYAKLTGQTSE